LIDIAAMSPYDDIMSDSRALTNVRSLPRLGTAVRMLRMRRGLTQAELAQLADVSRQRLIKLEAGKTAGLEIGLVLHVLGALDARLMSRAEAPGRRLDSGRCCSAESTSRWCSARARRCG